ncbi:MAG: DUF952 domain-containing protein [Bacteroidetes bacterium]|nr:DUF952 domain-containing protein [Bacteroidota bacterium]
MQQGLVPRIWQAPVYHVTTKAAWEQALQLGKYEAPSLHTEGFIHTSDAHQVAGVLERFYAGQTDLLRLCIDPAKLDVHLKYEAASDVPELFPHIYGPIPVQAVIAVEAL